MKSPVSLFSSLLKSTRRMDLSVKGLDRDLLTVKHRYEHEGISFFSVTLCTLGDALDRGISEGHFLCPTSFRKKKGSALPAFTWGLLSKVFDSETGLLRDFPDVLAITELRHMYRLFKKVQVSSARTERLEHEATTTFFETDNSLRDHLYDDTRRDRLFSAVSRLVLPNLERFRDYAIRSRHGPGAVFEPVKGNQKWGLLTESLLSGSFDPSDTDLDLFAIGERSLDVPDRRQSSSGVSKLVFVPKSATAVRTITVEPMLNQFVQQGLNTVLRDHIKKCNILSLCLDLNSQEPNQHLALEGSISGKWATLDLKSASDLLSLRLVRMMFDSKPLFFESLMRSRSSHVVHNNFCYELHKFAGMGNATTFPVQSMAFAILCICSILDTDGKEPSYGNVRAAASACRVFGDDVVIKTQYADTFTSWLTHFGLRVNVNKSFSKGNFRESCGVDAYNGVDVTPVYIRVDTRKKTFTTSELASLVSTMNQLWFKGYHELSEELRGIVEKSLGTLPIVSRDSGLLGLHDRVDKSEFHKWNRTLQVPCVEGYRLSPRKRRDSLDGYAALLKFFLTPLIERNKNHLEVSTVRYKSRLVKARVPI